MVIEHSIAMHCIALLVYHIISCDFTFVPIKLHVRTVREDTSIFSSDMPEQKRRELKDKVKGVTWESFYRAVRHRSYI